MDDVLLDPMINIFTKTPKAGKIKNGLLKNVKTTNAMSQTIETYNSKFHGDLDDEVKLVSKDV